MFERHVFVTNWDIISDSNLLGDGTDYEMFPCTVTD
jgi:hypothetical protein